MLNKYLQEHIVKIGGHDWIHCPFVVDIFSGIENEDTMLNEEYEEVKAARAKALEEKRYEDYIFLTTRPYRFQAMDEVFCIDDMDLERRAKIIMDVWADSELPGDGWEKWTMLMAFHLKSKTFADSKKNLPERFKVWRGGDADGISWTTDENVAKKFSMMYGRTGEMHSKEIARNEVVFYTNDRQEKEVILLQ